MRNYFHELVAIERDASGTKKAIRAYEPGGMGHRILTRRLDRLRAEWRQVEAERREMCQAAIENQISPNGISAYDCR